LLAKEQQEQARNNNLTEEKQFVDSNGNGTIKGSQNGIYHVPGSTYYSRTTNPVAWFKIVSEAVQSGYVAPKR
jgi:DNA-entry nuclease